MKFSAFFLFGVSLFLAGCGDGGGSSGTPAPATPAPTYSVGGTVSGLAGSGLTLKSGNNTLAVAGNGNFVLPTKLANGASYNLTVSAQPNSPSQVCAVKDGAGLVANADVSGIAVICITEPLTFAYASVRESAANQSIGLLEYFLFDPATGRLSLQGSIAAPQNTSVTGVKAAPSGIQLLVSTATNLGMVGRVTNYRYDMTLYDLSPTNGAPSPSRLVSSPGGGGLFHPNGIDLYTTGGPGGDPVVRHYSLAVGAAQGQSLTLAGTTGGWASAISPDGKFLFVPFNDLNQRRPNYCCASFIATVSLSDPQQPQLAIQMETPYEALTATMSPDGRLLYVTGVPPHLPGDPATGVGHVYSVSPSGGLTPLGTFATSAHPTATAITPSGNFLYVVSSNKMEGYRLDGAGGVTPLGTDIPVPYPYGVTLDPDGKYLYVLTGAGGGSPPAIYGFAIGVDGALTPVPGSPFANGERVGNLTFARASP